KLGAKWRPAAVTDRRGVPHCPACGRPYSDKDGGLLPPEGLAVRPQQCPCGEQLWQYSHDIDRWAPATFIHKHLSGYFRYLILDEVHEEKSATSAQANAAGALAASCQKVIAMTGTLLGGYAEHLRPLLWRLA